MPSSTETRIEELCTKIRGLCSSPQTLENETTLRELARELRAAINSHVKSATSSLNTKFSAISERDPAEK